jgi:uncharacterized integral membrane protein
MNIFKEIKNVLPKSNEAQVDGEADKKKKNKKLIMKLIGIVVLIALAIFFMKNENAYSFFTAFVKTANDMSNTLNK